MAAGLDIFIFASYNYLTDILGGRSVNKGRGFFTGRQGMDEFSKYLFWYGASFLLMALLLRLFKGPLVAVLSSIALWIGAALLIYSFVRAFSRRLDRREAENLSFIRLCAQRRQKRLDAKERWRQRKSYKFYKCPGCGTMIRVPKGKGKIHIRCKCGYTLYRKT